MREEDFSEDYFDENDEDDLKRAMKEDYRRIRDNAKRKIWEETDKFKRDLHEEPIKYLWIAGVVGFISGVVAVKILRS